MPTPSQQILSVVQLESLISAPSSPASLLPPCSGLHQLLPGQCPCLHPMVLPSVLHTGPNKLSECNVTVTQIHMCAHAHIHTSTLQVFQCLSTPNVCKPNSFGPGILGELIFQFHWSILSSMEPLLTSLPLSSSTTDPSILFLFPIGWPIPCSETPISSHADLPHCTVSLARTEPSYSPLYSHPLAQWPSHPRYSVGIC